jgi:hypothetical protein
MMQRKVGGPNLSITSGPRRSIKIIRVYIRQLSAKIIVRFIVKPQLN